MANSRASAEEYVRSCSEDDGPDDYEETSEIFAAIFGRRPTADDGDRGALWSHCCAAVASEASWAVLDTREGGNYGRIVSRHATESDATAAGSAHANRELGEPGARPPATRDAVPRLMWDVAQVDGVIGDRVRYR